MKWHEKLIGLAVLVVVVNAVKMFTYMVELVLSEYDGENSVRSGRGFIHIGGSNSPVKQKRRNH